MAEPQSTADSSPSTALPAALTEARKKGASKKRKCDQDADVSVRQAYKAARESMERRSYRRTEAAQKSIETSQTQRAAMMKEFVGFLIQITLRNESLN